MKRKLPAIITLCAVTAARASDITTTLHFNPSLSHEANPIASCMGADASMLLLSNVLVVVVLFLVPLFLYWRFPAASPQSSPANLREFIGFQLYGRALSRSELLRAIVLCVPFPRNWLQVLRCVGFAGSWTVVFGSFLAVFSWWAIWEWHWRAYQQFRAIFSIAGYPTMEVFLSLAIFYLVAVRYFRMEFSAYCNDRNG